uniref:hypothetical protein n=1 Tax=Microseira wollei TaxID=467598 RepID=UPI001CFE5416
AEWRFCEADASRTRITNRAWQWVYGMLAVYGLRPHEIFNLDLGCNYYFGLTRTLYKSLHKFVFFSSWTVRIG